MCSTAMRKPQMIGFASEDGGVDLNATEQFRFCHIEFSARDGRCMRPNSARANRFKRARWA
jgi:hypothetical protein